MVAGCVTLGIWDTLDASPDSFWNLAIADEVESSSLVLFQ